MTMFDNEIENHNTVAVGGHRHPTHFPTAPVSRCPSSPMSQCHNVQVSQCPRRLGVTEKRTRGGGMEKRTIFGTDTQTDRHTEVHIEVVPT